MSSEINGLHLCDHYIPKELLTLILSHVPPAALPRLALVCEEWNAVIKDGLFWQMMFKRRYPKREAKDLPWYVYFVLLSTDFFDTNLIRHRSWPWEFNRGFFKLKRGCMRYAGEKVYFINLETREVYSKILKEYKPNMVFEATKVNLHCLDINMIGTKMRSRVEDWKEINETKSQMVIDNYPDDIEQICIISRGEPPTMKISFDSILNK